MLATVLIHPDDDCWDAGARKRRECLREVKPVLRIEGCCGEIGVSTREELIER